MAEDLVRTVYARVKMESVCFSGRVEKDGAHAKRPGDVERTCVNDSRRSMALAVTFDRVGEKKEWERTVSAWRRYVDVSISRVDSRGESSVGRGRDSRCNESNGEGMGGLVDEGVA
jgi:hypothetical protein